MRLDDHSPLQRKRTIWYAVVRLGATKDTELLLFRPAGDFTQLSRQEARAKARKKRPKKSQQP